MTRPRAWRLDRVRTRLLAAFGVLLVAAFALAIVGWFGMRSTQQALAGLEDDLLPNIARALELAQRTTQLAAIAPKLAESRSEAELAANRATVEDLLGQIQRRSADLQPTGALQGVLHRLHDDVGRYITALIELTQRKQALQARFQQQLARVDRIGQRLHAPGVSPPDPLVLALWSSLVLGTATDDPAMLGRLQADVEALAAAAQRRGLLAALEPAIARELAAQAGSDGVLAQRHALLDLEHRTGYLVVLTRASADELSEQVSHDVAQLRASAAERSTRVQRAVRSGETGMLALALACLIIAVGATRYVRQLVTQIEKITDLMSRLAQGDTAPQPTPAVTRRDELGALARSFEVFRGHLLAKQQLVEALHTQRELLEAVHESMTDGLAVFDRDSRLLLWNTRFSELFGRHGATPSEGMTACALLERLPPRASWLAPGHAQRQALTDTTSATIARLNHLELHLPDGQVLDLRSRKMPGGGSVTLATDLTERRAGERQLQQAQKLEVLGQLTGGVAHDFNNYLGTILGTLALLEGELADPKSHAQWQRVQRAAASAAALTRRLLAFARRLPLQAEDVAVDEMVQEMHDLIEYSAGPQVVVNLALDSAPWRVHVDRGQLENALLNLVLNSAAAMPDGGRLELATRRIEGATPMIELRVVDSGTGVPEGLIDKVFEPFFTTRKDGGGSGLGLSIVYGFVKQSGGDVRLASKPGAGTTVTLTLPATPGANAAPVPVGMPSASAASLAGLQVLVVDDDEAFRDTLLEQLAAAGANAQGVPSAEAALAVLEAGELPDAVLSDVCLGAGPDGLRLARVLHQRWPELPLVLMSGVSPELLPQQAQWTGASPFLHKPFAIDTVAAALHGSIAVVSRF